MGNPGVRRIVTGFDDDGRAVITDDGPAPNSIDTGPVGVSEVLWCDGPDLRIDDDPDRDGEGFPLEPPPGGASARIIRMPGAPAGADPDDTWLRVDSEEPGTPGMHTTDTLDLMVVLDGSVVMGLPDGERTIGPGEFVVQRGTAHRWRPADATGWTYLVAMLRPDPAGPPASPTAVEPARVGDTPIRRVVTGTPTIDGGAATAVGGAMSTLTDLWHTGGALRDPQQGGDAPGPWALEPVAGGVSFRLVELSPDMPILEEAWHATATVDVDVVLSGRVRLELPDEISTEVGPGEVVIQRGTNHRWTALGDEPLRMATVMFAAAPAAPPPD